MNDKLKKLQKIRNLGIIAHIDAGKTTVSERILYYTHKINYIGEVHNGNATMDFMPEEQERGISIVAASTYCKWNSHHFNFIDTPGHVDFTIEVERSLRILDSAIGIFCSVRGVEPQSETVWRQSESLAIPKLAFINKMDKAGANFEYVLQSIEEKLHANPLLTQIPLYRTSSAGEEFYAIADLIHNKKLEFDEDDQGETVYTDELTGEDLIMASIWREKLLENLADKDDIFLNIFLSEEYEGKNQIPSKYIQEALRRVCIARLGVPTLLGAALKNIGIQPLLNAVCDYLPSPLDSLASMNETIDSTISFEKEDFQALVFKIFFEENKQIALLRLYNGKLINGMYIRNISQKNDAQIMQICRMHADFQEEIEEAYTGEIVAVLGIDGVKTGDTLGMPNDERLLETLSEYKPVISLAFEAKNEEEASILDIALKRYTLEDPTLTVQLEEVSGHHLVSGMGELHLDVLKKRIIREYKIEPRIGKAQVVLCETLLQNTEDNLSENTEDNFKTHILFEKEIEEKKQHADISLSLFARQRGLGNTVRFAPSLLAENAKTSEESCFNSHIIDTIRKSAEETLLNGTQNGAILQDIHVQIDTVKIKYANSAKNLATESVSTITAFQIATNLAIKEALEMARTRNKIQVLEPIMSLELLVPDENLSACINLLNTCSAKIDLLYTEAGQKCIIATAPMRELFGFATRIRSASQGRARLLIEFKEYNSI